MSRDPVPEWFGKGEADPPRQRGSAEARSSVGCGMPVALALLIAAAGVGAFFMVRRPSPKVTATVPTSTQMPPTPEPADPLQPVPVPTPQPAEDPTPVPASAEPAEPAEPQPEPAASAEVAERLSAAQIRTVMMGAKNRFRTCYENALKYAPDAEGRVTLSLTISPAGRAQVASTSQTGNLPPQVGTCIGAISRTLKFPESSEPTTVTYPFVFNRQ